MISVGILLRNFKKFRNLRKEDCLFFFRTEKQLGLKHYGPLQNLRVGLNSRLLYPEKKFWLLKYDTREIKRTGFP